jgi:cell division protein ZapA (FtsZ GTPase activity inhibitor)|tara:strand:- start:582 stop:821 length:240 start_codon:yes stop_codon:yes gene_type:complete
MKGQKQSRTDLLEKKIDALIKVVQQLLDENAYLKDLSVGTLETIKLMDDYEDAIEKLRAKVAEERSKAEEAKPLETPSN